ncbi:TonB-dependent receptor [Sphingobacterium sp.]|uniref:TonB-dependent receptor domain-containing protein n=1 Tax=Sphingobacterium sp. TaxID=341027 RepID=UPI0031D8BA0D
MKKIITVLLMATAVATLHAQSASGIHPGSFSVAEGKLSGQLIDLQGKPIAQASVNLLRVIQDQSTGKEREILFKSTSSLENGKFNFTALSTKDKWILKISSVGYVAKDIPVEFGSDSKMLDKNLGAITLENDNRKLAEVTVTGRKALLEMDIDKKVYNVEKNIVAAGGTAIDVMRNMPSVQVDIDGNVKLRNAAPTIFVDGKPTTLTPDQIPADVIEKIEIITNPSAKYDASGSMAGILNIILKKNKKTGYNGMVTLGADRFGGTNFMGSLNLRQNKFNISLTGMNMRMRTNTEGDSYRESTIDGVRSTVNQDIEGKTKGMISFGRLGLDYDLSPRTTVSVAGVLVQGKFRPNENTMIKTESQGNSNRISESERSFKPRGLQAGLVQKFKTQGEELTVDFNYFGGTNKSNGTYTTNYLEDNNGIIGSQIQKNIGSGDNKFMTIQADYVKPFKNGMKLETGVRAQINKLKNLNSNSLKARDEDEYKDISAASANYDNKNSVYAAYASLGGDLKDWVSYKVGLRVENSTYDGELINTNQKFHNKYPLSLFPSLFLSKKLTEKDQLQMSVTRRVNRPNFFQLIPFVDYTDSLNITRGNPDLVPEFTTSGELSYSRTQGKGTFLASFYYKKTTNLITRYLTQELNPITDKMDFINTYINANSSRNYGAEFTYTNNLKTWWDLTADLNFYNSKIEIDDKTATEGMWTVFGKLNNTFNLKKNWNLQLAFEYQGKTNMPVTQNQTFGPPMNQAQSSSQGYIKPFYGVDFAIKKSFLKNQAASVTLAINDIFRTRGNTIVSSGDGFFQEYYRLSNPQLVKLNLSYRFGKMDMNMFKKNKNQNSMEGMQMQ